MVNIDHRSLGQLHGLEHGARFFQSPQLVSTASSAIPSLMAVAQTKLWVLERLALSDDRDAELKHLPAEVWA